MAIGRLSLAVCAVVLVLISPVYASEADALAISANIQAKHLPFGTILDPIYSSPTSEQIVGYTRCGDSALWTGAYLAAEAFRYKVTASADALANVKGAVAGLTSLLDVTGNNLLARCIVPANSPYAAGIASEESANGIIQAAPWFWVGNTSRDEYVGAIFGLGIAYDMVNDTGVQSSIGNLVTLLVRFLTGNNWKIAAPGSADSFLVRPDELLALLQVARHVNSDQFSDYYDEQRILLGTTVGAPAGFDTLSDDSYFKFNLDYMTFYNLVRLESSSWQTVYASAYQLVRDHTAPQLNGFFDVVDRGLNGVDVNRDSENRMLLDQLLMVPTRDVYVDLTKSVAVCGSQACAPVPVPLRPPEEFLWQVSPFQLIGGGTGGGSGIIEDNGIDYILPYWMARYYGVVTGLTVYSAASVSPNIAPDSLAALYGTGLASTTTQASSLPLPTTLGGISVTVTDGNNVARLAPLIYVSPSQINFVVPDGTAAGAAMVSVNGASTTEAVQTVAPTLFTINGAGAGTAAATAIQVQSGNIQVPIPVFTCVGSTCAATPVNVTSGATYLTLYGTGIRNRSALSKMQVTVNGMSLPATFAGAQGAFAGLDQVNVLLPASLAGSGVADIMLTVDGQISNVVTIEIK
ncbi:MAG TPA: hypothetical protein VKG25_06220 [Bryobacteraceae bacterium]|nr:hypothetical protein [Bryobacteraceae bacterium]